MERIYDFRTLAPGVQFKVGELKVWCSPSRDVGYYKNGTIVFIDRKDVECPMRVNTTDKLFTVISIAPNNFVSSIVAECEEGRYWGFSTDMDKNEYFLPKSKSSHDHEFYHFNKNDVILIDEIKTWVKANDDALCPFDNSGDSLLDGFKVKIVETGSVRSIIGDEVYFLVRPIGIDKTYTLSGSKENKYKRLYSLRESDLYASSDSLGTAEPVSLDMSSLNIARFEDRDRRLLL